ncbi:hypothetical protein [Tenacibaculum maritimum]|uniref:hypothetical protein n=1 Tax=Tenacibaculum maritimum TaxID=107401 RepID=UPI0012E5563D|nr:hypothetical protein [Tenacibaculum maritimum]CAA0151244.1 Probable lipoprotein precursor [Tenacibaculum maritimum]CAA0223222.1 Probable lipoprotein precursor [Tenacibaculum maritimum]
MKKIKILSLFLVVFFQSCTNNSDGLEMEDESGQDGSIAIMTANLDGTQYDDLKPNLFNVIGNAVDVVTLGVSDVLHLRIRANSSYEQLFPEDDTKEITIYIPQSKWAVGSYDLDFHLNDVEPYTEIIFNFPNGDRGLLKSDKEKGNLTITKFDLSNRIIEGTFNFEYYIEKDVTWEVIGPFNCLNGTFKFSLDDKYFD